MVEVSKYKDECVGFLRRLIQTPSVNGRDYEESIVAGIANEAKKLQLPHQIISKDRKRPNIFVGNNFSGKDELLLVAHTDTVPEGDPKSWEHSPFEGIIEGNQIFGRGAVDCKGGIAISLYTLKILNDMGKLDRAKFVGVADEESGADSKLGLMYLLEQGLRAKEAVYTYGSGEKRDYLIIGHRGVVRLWVECLGEAIHSGSKEWQDRVRGENAIDGLVELLMKLKGYNQPGQNEYFPGYGFVMTPTLVSGGSGESIVPASAKALLDIRTLPEHSNEQIIEDIKEVASKFEVNKKRFNVLVKNNVPGALTDPDADIVTRARRLITELEGVEPKLSGSGPANEGYMLIKRGIPTITGFGPKGKNYHSINEYALIDSIGESLQILTELSLI